MTLEITLRLAVALGLGALIGLERQVRQRHAGLRTNTLVSIGSALFVTLSLMAENEVSPTRVAAQVVSGIGFLGAGVIMREGSGIRGLNTAATLWCSAAIGVLCGAGYLLFAAIGTGMILITNMGLRHLSWRINQSRVESDHEVETCYLLSLVCREQDESHLRELLVQEVSDGPLRLRSLTSADISPAGKMSIEAELHLSGRTDQHVESLVARISSVNARL